VAGARAAVLPAISATAGLPAVEALAAGCPVVASGVGSLPEIVGAAGLIVEPRDPARLATALATIWGDDALHATLVEATRPRSGGDRRSWADVARETRVVYGEGAARS
jgi:glycosyltransferase involved in cell wall biosynthesis